MLIFFLFFSYFFVTSHADMPEKDVSEKCLTCQASVEEGKLSNEYYPSTYDSDDTIILKRK